MVSIYYASRHLRITICSRLSSLVAAFAPRINLFGLLHPFESAGHGLVGRDKLALRKVGPQLPEERSIVPVIEISEDGLQRFSGLFSIVKGNAAAHFSSVLVPMKLLLSCCTLNSLTETNGERRGAQ